MGFARPAPRSKQYHGSNPSAPRVAGLPAVLPKRAAPVAAILKTPARKNQSIRDSARDEDCTVRIIGACNFDKATTIWSHLPSLAGDRGMGLKALDECGAYSCSGCHDVVDMRAPLPAGATRESVLIDWFNGHMRSLVRLRQKGIL